MKRKKGINYNLILLVICVLIIFSGIFALKYCRKTRFLNNYVYSDGDKVDLYFVCSFLNNRSIGKISMDVDDIKDSQGKYLKDELEGGPLYISKICRSESAKSSSIDVGNVYIEKAADTKKLYDNFEDDDFDDNKGVRTYTINDCLTIDGVDVSSYNLIKDSYNIYINDKNIKDIQFPLYVKKEDGIKISYEKTDDDLSKIFSVNLGFHVFDKDKNWSVINIPIQSRNPESYNSEEINQVLSIMGQR